jgi:hypothetical protein
MAHDPPNPHYFDEIFELFRQIDMGRDVSKFASYLPNNKEELAILLDKLRLLRAVMPGMIEIIGGRVSTQITMCEQGERLSEVFKNAQEKAPKKKADAAQLSVPNPREQVDGSKWVAAAAAVPAFIPPPSKNKTENTQAKSCISENRKKVIEDTHKNFPKFYNVDCYHEVTPGGCREGDKCPFKHVNDGNLAQTLRDGVIPSK